jgi:hypothetical protein
VTVHTQHTYKQDIVLNSKRQYMMKTIFSSLYVAPDLRRKLKQLNFKLHHIRGHSFSPAIPTI